VKWASLPEGLSSLRHSGYRIFLLGQAVALQGTWVQGTAQRWLVLEITNSPFYVGVLGAVTGMPILLFSIIGGMLADRVSLRAFVILAPAMTAIPMSLTGVAPSYGVLVLLLLLAGISAAMFHVPAPVMIARMAGARTGTGMSFFMTGGELARTVGPVVAVGAVSLMGLEGFWPVMTAGIAASIMLYIKFRRLDLDFHDGNGRISLVQTVKNMRLLLLPLIFILVARSFMHASMTAFLPTFIREQSGSIWLGGIGLTLFEAAGVTGVLAAGSLSDIIGRRSMLLISLTGAPLGVLAFVMNATAGNAGADSLAAAAALLITGFMLLSTTPVMLAMVQEHAGNSPAAANGIYMMVAFIARSSVVVVIGLIGDHAGLYTAYIISAAAGACGIPFIMMLPGRGTG
jgi:FSR family fosmidomycin resistance protein-like MFS transporter